MSTDVKSQKEKKTHKPNQPMPAIVYVNYLE